jgi:S1-C subfamily serine protease
LVNTNGDLIGINSAIQSTTGYYQGYGFAVPANLARKIVEDIKKFGIVQRGFLGVTSLDLSNDQLVAAYNKDKKTNYKSGSGVLVTGFGESSGAEDAGLKKEISSLKLIQRQLQILQIFPLPSEANVLEIK